jgi:hypothetical protein
MNSTSSATNAQAKAQSTSKEEEEKPPVKVEGGVGVAPGYGACHHAELL